MTPNFKVGDNVVCIDNTGCSEYLTIDYGYIVSDVRIGKRTVGITLVGTPTPPGYKGYNQLRFVKRDIAHDERHLVEQLKSTRSITEK